MSPDPGTYLAYGLILTSSIALPELPRHEGGPPDLWVTQVPPSGGEHGVPNCSDENGKLTVVRADDSVHLRFPGRTDFVVSVDFRRIECRPRPGVPPVTIRHLLIDQVVPSVLAGLGELVLHASSVGLPGGAIVVLAPSGGGKSTLAAVLNRRGRPVLCDDGARLVEDGSRFTAVPSYPGLRLWPDGLDVLVGSRLGLDEVTHDSPKRRWAPGGEPAETLDLACVFVLDDSDDAVEIAPMSKREALSATLEQSYRIPGGGPDHVRQHFERAVRLVASSPFFRLSYPYDFSRIEEVADLVEAHVAAIGA